MTNITLASLSPVSTEQGHSPMDNGTENSSLYCSPLEDPAIFSLTCVVCIIGLVGNGTVIWLLGFRMKRNPFTTYILNLAVADFGVLIAITVIYIADCNVTEISHFLFSLNVAELFYQVVYSASQFLLTSISIDRCVSVLFPLWYRCHRPENLSTILCVLIWIFCFLVNGICTTLSQLELSTYFSPTFYAFLVNAVLSLPVTTISTLILFIRICFKSQQRQRGKLLMTIFLTLFFFLILAFPLNVICLVDFARTRSDDNSVTGLVPYGLLCAALNSFVNPLIYFLVGRKKKGLCRENLKLILRRVFSEEEVYIEKLKSSTNPNWMSAQMSPCQILACNSSVELIAIGSGDGTWPGCL